MAPPPVYAKGALLAARFEIVRRIGEGGMGVVYEAIDHERGATVALKSITQPDPTAIFRFKREFRALADIVHPNLVPLYELVSDGEQWFFTMQLVEGVDLARFLRPRAKASVAGVNEAPSGALEIDAKTASDPAITAATALHRLRDGEPPAIEQKPASIADRYEWSEVDWRKVRRTFAQLASAVRALHDASRLHRDLKPSNVLVRADGTVVVLDFGLVAELERGEDATSVEATGVASRDRSRAAHTNLSDEIVTGTIPYMAPEQVTGEPLTTACDWYAVGVMLYQVATGRLPHEGAPAKILANKVNCVPLAPRALNPSMPEDLDALCVALLQMQPGDRPAAGAVIDALLKAKSREMIAVELTDERAKRPFIGRAALLDELDAAWRATLDGRATLCVVRGATGDGKSTLIDHFIRTRVDGAHATVLRGRCFEHESVPFKTMDGVIDALVKHLLTFRADELEAMIPSSIGSLSALFPVLARAGVVMRAARKFPAPADVAQRRALAEDALRTLLRAMSASRPVIIVVDDAQWGDVDGMQLLAKLWDAPSVRAMVVVILRTDLEREVPALIELRALRERHPALRAKTLDVTALSADEARALARSLARRSRDGAADDLWIERMVDWSAGSPWLLELLIESHASLGVIARGHSLDSLLHARAEALSERERALLAVLCVAGHALKVRVAFDAALGQNAAPDALTTLNKAHLARTSGPTLDDLVEPFHERVRDGLLRTMSTQERALAHQRIARALEAASQSAHEASAQHWERAGYTARAAEQWLLAGRALLKANDAASAQSAFARAQSIGDEPVRSDARVALAELLLQDGDVRGAYELARSAFELPESWSGATLAGLIANMTIRAAFERARQPARARSSDVRLLTVVARGALEREPRTAAGVAATAVLACDASNPSRAAALAYYGAALGELDFVGVAHPEEWGRAALEALDEAGAAASRAEVLCTVAERCLGHAATSDEVESLFDRALTSALLLDEREWVLRSANAMIEHALLRGADERSLRALFTRLHGTLAPRALVSRCEMLAHLRALIDAPIAAESRGGGAASVTLAFVAFCAGADELARSQLAATTAGPRGTARELMRAWMQSVLSARALRDATIVERTTRAATLLAQTAHLHRLVARAPTRFEALPWVLDGELAESVKGRGAAVECFERARAAAAHTQNEALLSLCDRRLAALGAHGERPREWLMARVDAR